MANKAFKYRIDPDPEQKILLAKTFGCVRFIYNKMLGEKIDYYNSTGQMLYTTPAKYKIEFPWLKEVDSLALVNAQLHLETAYKNFFENPDTGFPKFKSKNYSKKSYTTNVTNNNIRIENGCLRLPKLGLVKIKLHRQIPKSYRIKSVTISMNPDGKYYASILTEYEETSKTYVSPFDSDFNMAGFDFSMKELYVDQDNHEPDYQKYYRKSEEKLAKAQHKLSRMKKGSKNYEKQCIKVAKIHANIANQRKDFLHKESRKIANSYDAVAIETLDMQAMSQCLNFGKSVHDNGWGMFTTFLKYKLDAEGKYFVKVSKWFASSQLCHVCGYQYPGTKDLSVRQWVCPHCHTHHDRDHNAAINIKEEGLWMLRECLSTS